MSRRLVLFGLLAASQLSTGCWCVRERIAWRWHNHGPAGCGPVCAPACNATPAFRIPSPVVGVPVSAAPSCSTCTTGMDPAASGFAGHGYAGHGYPIPVTGAGFVGAPPIIGVPMPLGTPRVETPVPMAPAPGTPKN